MPHVTLAEAKAHLRVKHASEDIIIGVYIAAAVSWLEGFTGRYIDSVAGVVENVEPDDLVKKSVYLTAYPVETVTDVSIDESTVDPSNYTVEIDAGGRALVTFVEAYDVTTDDPIAITATVGYPDGTLPAALKAALLLVIGGLYTDRGAGDTPKAAENLAAPYKVRIVAGA